MKRFCFLALLLTATLAAQSIQLPPHAVVSLTIGPTLPSTCGVGQVFFLTSATAGQNLYGCSAVNTWTLESGGAGGSMVYPPLGIPWSTGTAWGTSYGFVTTLGSPGLDTNIASEKAIATALTALLGGCSVSGSIMNCPGGFTSSGPWSAGGTHQSAASLPTPGANQNMLVFDSGNSDHLTRKDSSGGLHDLEAGGQTSVGVIAYSASAWTTGNSVLTAYAPDTINSDSSGGTIWSSSNPSRFVATSAGRWTIKAGFDTTGGGSSGGAFNIYFRVTHSGVGTVHTMAQSITIATTNSAQNATKSFNLASGDYVEVLYYTGGAIAMPTGVNESYVQFNKELW